MQLDEPIGFVSRLPPTRQQEVIDFAAFLEQRYGSKKQTPQVNWTDQEFSAMSIEQAMRGVADEPELYSVDDIQERWQ